MVLSVLFNDVPLERSDYSLERSDYLVERSDSLMERSGWNEVTMERSDRNPTKQILDH